MEECIVCEESSADGHKSRDNSHVTVGSSFLKDNNTDRRLVLNITTLLVMTMKLPTIDIYVDLKRKVKTAFIYLNSEGPG